jgi:hypothetical protein
MSKYILTSILFMSLVLGTFLSEKMICLEDNAGCEMSAVSSHCDMDQDQKPEKCSHNDKASCFCLNIILPSVLLTSTVQIVIIPTIDQLSDPVYNQVFRSEQPPLQPPTLS